MSHTDRISAGELRQMGFVFPDETHDSATVESSSFWLKFWAAKHELADGGPYSVFTCDFGSTVLDSKGFNCMRLGEKSTGSPVMFHADESAVEALAAHWNEMGGHKC